MEWEDWHLKKVIQVHRLTNNTIWISHQCRHWLSKKSNIHGGAQCLVLTGKLKTKSGTSNEVISTRQHFILITIWERLNLMETYSSTAFSLCWEYFWLPSRVHTLMVTNIIVDTLTGLLAATTDHNHYVSWALFTTV